MEQRLRAMGGSDVTFVLCADRQDIARLDAAERRCLHPEYVPTRNWAHRGGLSNGTISLALKHQIAYAEISRRRLDAALIVEDDAALPADMWQQLGPYSDALPTDAAVFYLGSYSATSRWGTLKSEPPLSSIGPRIHRRRNGSEPHLLGTLAYVAFARAIPALLHPVTVEADLTLALLPPSDACGPHCRIAGPREQYGPSEWLVGPDPASKQNSHGSRQTNKVIAGWVAVCRAAHLSGRPLNRNCHRIPWREGDWQGARQVSVRSKPLHTQPNPAERAQRFSR